MSNRKVTDANLQGPLFIMGIGQLSQQLSTVSGKSGKVKSLSMEADSSWLYVTVNGVTCGVPLPNVQSVTFAKENSEAKAIVISRPNEKNS